MLSGRVQWRAVGLVPHIQVGPAIQQRDDDGRVVVGPGRPMQGGGAPFLVARLDVSPGVQQRCDDVRVVVEGGGEMQRGVAPLILLVRVSPLVKMGQHRLQGGGLKENHCVPADFFHIWILQSFPASLTPSGESINSKR